ncbi:MAG: GDCCVxC domain-containing (seleno)protein [Gemmatimonadaceae bacterium]
MEVLSSSVLTCPECSHAETHEMPTDTCVFFYECAGCGALIRAKPGDCCVYCSYGSVPCPSVQENGRGCCGSGESGE